jgi:hypothetical protein
MSSKSFVRWQVLGQVLVDTVIEPPFRQRLLLGAHCHLQHLPDGSAPLRMCDDEWTVLQGVFRALDIDRRQWMGRIFQAEVDDVLRRLAKDLERPFRRDLVVRCIDDERGGRIVGLCK